ncbi:MAG: S9 family peptidase, partial [Gemmatimonadales bacterium]
MRRILLGIALIVLAPAQVLAQDTRTIEPEDYYRVQQVGSPALSPDGRHLLYTVQTVRRSSNDRITHIWWSDLEAGTNQRLSTQGVNSTNPNWTPDGRRIYFNTNRGGQGGTHFINFTEPGGEAYRIPGVTGNFTFHPSGEWVLVTRQVEVESDEEEAEEAESEEATGPRRAAADREDNPRRGYWPSGTPALTGPSDRAARGETEEDRNRDVYVISHNVYKRDGQLSFIGPSGGWGGGGGNDSYTQFFRIPADGLVDGQEPEQLTSDEVNKSFQGFTADGRYILYTVNLTQAEEAEEPEEGAPEEEADEEEGPEIGFFRMPAEGGEAEELVRVRGRVAALTLSPDYSMLALRRTEAPRTDPWIEIVDVATGEVSAELARDDWKYSIGNLTWSLDSGHVYFTSAIGGQDQLVRVDASGGPVERVTEGRHTFNGFDMNLEANRIAYVKSTPELPWEAWVADLDASNARQVTEVNADWLDGVRLSEVEYFTYEGPPHNRDWLDRLPEMGAEYMIANNAPDGERFEIDGWLVYPVDYDPNETYPMVVSIHGGPHSRYADTWFPEFQMLAAQGMFVLYTNPRGSSGYGMEFQYSTLEAWGIDDMKDILYGVDEVVARGVVDEDRLGVTGGSYGGFMTSWITAHDQRFRTALTARGIVNWLSFYGVSDASGLVEGEFGGMPWPYQSAEEGSYNLVMELSPIVWADRVETPTLIIHSINDYRTPLEGA